MWVRTFYGSRLCPFDLSMFSVATSHWNDRKLMNSQAILTTQVQSSMFLVYLILSELYF